MSLGMSERTINGVKYTATQIPLERSLNILSRLLGLLGEPLARVLTGVDSMADLKAANVDKKVMGDAIIALTRNAADANVYQLLKDLCAEIIATQEDKVRKDLPVVFGQLRDNSFDQHFVGGKGLARLFKVVRFSLEANYKDFLAEVTG